MNEPAKKIEQNTESYFPKEKPAILNLVQKIMESTPQIPAIEIYQAHREPYQVLGIENKTLNGTVGDWGVCWNQFFKSGGHDKIKPFLTEQPLLGVFCQSEPGYYNYLIGGVVSGVTDIPEDMFVAEFPATDYIVVTNEWMKSIDEAEQQVGRIVGYAHGNELQLPDGYVKYNGPPSKLMFIESYNYDFKNNRFRFEVWLPVKMLKGE
ncbi:MAG: hypothetical protein A2Y17_04885 [Clostridiales bacterium GWF2_38_85]|nr:MAG: hypothetical protein A2Y17_04885 [Clostridiales bacterium GWF2_38_85]HBL84377.1 hypothetical protein [Clostridiales bacterium]